MWIWILFAFQVSLLGSEQQLYNRILEETNRSAQLRLVLDFEKQFPQSMRIGEIHTIAMDCYRSQNNAAKLVEYGEKAIRTDPENIHVLLVLARQYALEGRNFDRAVSYAGRALKVAQGMRDKPVPAGYNKQEWMEYVRQSITSAQSTLNYIQSIPKTLTKRNPKND